MTWRKRREALAVGMLILVCLPSVAHRMQTSTGAPRRTLVSRGFPLGERPSPGAWSVAASAKLSSATTSNTFAAVSCGEPGACMAVGESDYPNGASALAQTRHGRTWLLVPGPSDGPNLSLAGVSCTSSTQCVVMGLTRNGSLNTFASWDGTKWSSLPGRTGGLLQALSCVSAAFCMAVGQHHPAPENVTLVVTWSGKLWSTMPSPNRGGAGDFDHLEGVSCVSRRFCAAVGDYGVETPHRSDIDFWRTLIEIWDGTRWSVVPSPDAGPSWRFDTLNAVSCASPTFCVAVGSYANFGGMPELTLIERWDGTRWSLMPSPNWGGRFATDHLNGVSCPSANRCVAAGDYEPVSNGGLSETLVEAWADGRWTVVPSPTPASRSEASLQGVSCASEDFCVAVGQKTIGSSQRTEPLIEEGPARS